MKGDLYLEGDKKIFVTSGVDRKLAGQWLQVKGGIGEMRQLWC